MAHIRQIKPGTYLQCVCSWCGQKPLWRPSSLSSIRKYACDEHRIQLALEEQARRIRDDHMSEADHQTWGRL